ncbi:uncharacterized protein EI90DRAFT_2905164, partial [Cantharellus anzutake]|uniref:uncharacterized protein n=1 Tax=Cantharellus anzutake TaxID=1750568 RepID=UPI001902DFEC
IYADKSKLSTFGSVTGYPVIARLSILPHSIRNAKGTGGGCLIGWLPEASSGAEKCNQKAWATFQSYIYQQAMSEVLSSLHDVAYWGVQLRCADDILRRVFPFVYGLIANNQEGWTMLAMRGAKSLKPCTICLVPRDALHRLDMKYPRCSKSETSQIIRKAQTMAKGPAEELLQSYGLRAHESVFNQIHNSDPHWAISFDILHTWQEGVWGGHTVPIIQTLIPLLGLEVIARFESV